MVRTHAVEAVARLAGADALPHLVPLSRDSEVRIRSEAAAALALIDAPDARSCLRALLDDAEISVRIQALSAYARAYDEDFGFRLEDHQGALDFAALDNGAGEGSRVPALIRLRKPPRGGSRRAQRRRSGGRAGRPCAS